MDARIRQAPASLSVSYAKSRYTARGRLARPATVAAGEACAGNVTVTVKRGKRTLTTRRADVRILPPAVPSRDRRAILASSDDTW